MRKTYLLLLLFTSILFAFSGCSDDDEDGVVNANEIEGEWLATAYLVDGVSEFDPDDETTWIFDDGDFEEHEEGTLSVAGSYEVKGNQLIITLIGEEGATFNIEELSSTTLKVNTTRTRGSDSSKFNFTFRKVK
ncbi:MAG: lipocalin family protein [Rufibacter sp.]